MVAWDESLEGVLVLPNGSTVRGLPRRIAFQLTPPPELLVRLAGRRPVQDDPHQRWIRWPDFRAPTDTGQALNELRTAFERCAEERVLISCRGGIGRTGTALTVMVMLAGMRCGCAVEWVRERYSPRGRNRVSASLAEYCGRYFVRLGAPSSAAIKLGNRPQTGMVKQPRVTYDEEKR